MPAASPCPRPRVQGGSTGQVAGCRARALARLLAAGTRDLGGGWILIWSCGRCYCSRLTAGLASQIGSKWLCTKKTSLCQRRYPDRRVLLPWCIPLLAGAPGCALSSCCPDTHNTSLSLEMSKVKMDEALSNLI